MWHRRTLEELAYFSVRDSVSLLCASDEARELMQTRLPLTEAEKIEELKELSREWEKTLGKTPVQIRGWPPVHSLFRILDVEGTALDQSQALAILQFVSSAISSAEEINAVSKTLQIKSLAELFSSMDILSLESVKSEISKVIDNEGNIKDLPALREIRENIARIHAEISSALKKYTSDTSLSPALASNVPAFRADRQVLAVKASHRLKIPGIVHEVSSSGQTFFIEPDEVVRKNNELIQEEFHLQSETRKILTQLTAKVAVYAHILKPALKTMIKIDQVCAAARWGIKNKCIYALPCAQKDGASLPPSLIQARHPLLAGKAVPIDMKFMAGKTVLIITGPNTGGKTVAIKTFALLAMLNQTGFPVPAAEGTRLPVFSSLFADIGDEQSIDQSLSTFSAHMKNIAAAVKHADENSLVLLDELGSGTDPQEGGAIGMAILDHLIETRAFVLVTTHHGILKNYGYTNPSCINASVEFDNSTLSPTYNLLMGVPGESHALDIAKRSGLPSRTVEKAKSYINSQQADVSSLIKGLTEKHAELAELEKEAKEREKTVKEKENKLELKMISLQEKQIELEEREQRKASEFVEQAHKELENLVRLLREGEITRAKTIAVKQFLNRLSEEDQKNTAETQAKKLQLEEDRKKLEREEESVRLDNGMLITRAKDTDETRVSRKKKKKTTSNKDALKNARNTYSPQEAERLTLLAASSYTTKPARKEAGVMEFTEGAQVMHSKTRAKGTLVSRTKKDVWSVQFGSIRMDAKEKDLVLLRPESGKPSISIELANASEGQAKPVFELRLLGMREEEAIRALERQLDLCQLNNFKSFSIIHGKGNGILQQAVSDYLANYPAVKGFRFASPEDGGTGKTYVEMS